MNFRVFLSENRKYIICRVYDPMTTDTAVAFSREMDRLSREHGIKRFLTDVRAAPNTSSVMENYSFTQIEMSELGLQKDVRSAILASQSDRSHDFVEFASRNAGFNVRLFDDETAAIAWLEQ